MSNFDRLVNEQLKTMERLLFLQSEIERCQEIEQQLRSLEEEAELESLQHEIMIMKNNLSEIQQIFEDQTEEVIRSYQQSHINI
ncbi:TolA-binding protein [Peribacillus deserti]|uniref:TolA-binding protein n=1 Tax=Peribacillus deserti TaxID=673318 RepID=A0ABS2QKS2_9BACI|nr:YgaB family protein [Peribacillus deserti]MBM7693600.1 TolA-binding protein [Peribacillus deserti]